MFAHNSPNKRRLSEKAAMFEEGAEPLHRVIKKRNRPCLSCGPCRLKKIRCERGHPCNNCLKKGIADQCIYDERLNQKKSRSSRSSQSSKGSRRLHQQSEKEQPVSTHDAKQDGMMQPGPRAKKPETAAEPSHKRSPDVCVLINRSELEALQAKVKTYESLKQQKSGSTQDALHNHSIRNFHPKKNVVYNQSANTYRNVIFSTHEEARPGYIPLDDVTTDKFEKFVDQPTMSVTSEVSIFDLFRSDRSMIGMNPYSSPDDVIDLYSQISSRYDLKKPRGIYPLSWSYAIRGSPTMLALKSFASKQKAKEETKRVAAGITYDPLKKLMLPKDAKIKSALHLDGSIISVFEAKTEETSDDHLNVGGATANNNKNNNGNNNQPTLEGRVTGNGNGTTTTTGNGKVNMTTLALGLSVLGGTKDREDSLIEQIKTAMPPKRVVWSLLARFVRLLYPLMPFLIEDRFRASIESIIGKESYEDEKPEVLIQSRLDFANIAILFVILRLSYLSLFHNRGFHNEKILTKEVLSPEEAEKKYLLLNPINLATAEIAVACYYHLERLGKISVPLLQCAIYLRIYRVYAPEEGDGLDGGESHMHTSVLSSMGYYLGLNREPDYVAAGQDEKLKNLYRKMWYFMVSSEHSYASIYGSPISIRKESYDTKRPYFSEKNSNLINQEIDKTSYYVFAFIAAMIRGPVNKITELYANVKGGVKVVELTNHLNHLEQGLKSLLGKFSDYIYALEEHDSGYHTSKVMKVQILLKMNAVLMLNYCYLMRHYEHKNRELCMFYLKKLLTVALYESLPYVFALITKSQEAFGEGADLYLNPSIIQLNVKISDICLISIVRSNIALYNLSKQARDQSKRPHEDFEYEQTVGIIRKFISLMEKCFRVCLAAVSILSSRYYFAWEVVRTQNYYLKIATNANFYKEKWQEAEGFPIPQHSQLKELVDITTASLDKLMQLVETYCEEVDLPGIFKMGREGDATKNGNNAPVNSTPCKKPTVETPTRREVSMEKMPLSESASSSSGQRKISDSITPTSSSDFNGLYFTGFEEMRFDNSAEIDSIWLQMLSTKNVYHYAGVAQEQPSSQLDGYNWNYMHPNVAHANASAQNSTDNDPVQVPPVANFGPTGFNSGVQQAQMPPTDPNLGPPNTGYQSYPNPSQFTQTFPVPSIFNSSELFEDLPLEKLFSM
ncbi:uncharacterized protein LODBEIA_P34320 [Lodderomyces beijingensis]|uniref:Zn(2)-C6 fungal-type domain-containing protein n=1 Tax=Lodderomyces beijingensis TaxID=1775926 RepID=A0ABP0ZM15_9ASCO